MVYLLLGAFFIKQKYMVPDSVCCQMSHILSLKYKERKILCRVELSILFIDIHATLSYAPTSLGIGFIFINELDKLLNMEVLLLFCPWPPGALRIHGSVDLLASTPIPVTL